MLNDDEIVTSVQEESVLVDDETDEDEDINNTKVARVHQMMTRFLRVLQSNQRNVGDLEMELVLLSFRRVAAECSRTCGRSVADNWANLKSATQIAELFDNYEDRSKLMAELLTDLGCHLDDIAIFSDTWESHIKHMETVLQRIKRAKLTIKTFIVSLRNKCQILGHIVGLHFRDQSSGCSRVPLPLARKPKTCFLRYSGLLPKIYKSVLGLLPLTDALKEEQKEGRN
ncbi:hypothetical protein TNCV_3632571 [Trichonephila clavipes]|nr:hypothetical protein TNCV_3632571 [Trichonephila clavipes]